MRNICQFFLVPVDCNICTLARGTTVCMRRKSRKFSEDLVRVYGTKFKKGNSNSPRTSGCVSISICSLLIVPV